MNARQLIEAEVMCPSWVIPHALKSTQDLQTDGGNCGQFAYALAKWVNAHGGAATLAFATNNDPAVDTEAALFQSEPDVYHVCAQVGDTLYDGTGTVTRDGLADLAEDQYGDFDAALWDGVEVTEQARQFISGNTDWSTEWMEFYRAMERGAVVTESSVSVASDANYAKAVEAGDMATAQRMVDEAAKAAGYSVEGFHGTDENFTEFRMDAETRRDSGEKGKGFYFATEKEYASLHGKNTGRFWVKLQNPFPFNEGSNRIKIVLDIAGPRPSDGLIKGVAGANLWSQKVRDGLIALGYDGAVDTTETTPEGIKRFAREFVVFSPNQIKSSDPVTRDDEGNIIPLSMRFNASSNDIRESDDSHYTALQNTGFWGSQGAGCIFLAKSTGRILLQHRSRAVQEPGTWGTFGGAIDAGEAPEDAVRREVREETGYSGSFELVPLAVFTSGSFRYSNFLAIVEDEFEPDLGWEADGAEWFTYGDWPAPLHFGLRNLLNKSGAEIAGRCRKGPLSESEELFRAGQSPDDFDGKAPKVDWDAVDNYGHAWDEDTVEKFLNETPGWTYPAMVDASDLQPKLVEYDEADEIRKMSEQEFRERYPDLFVNEGENGEDEVYDWRDLRDKEAESERSSWDGGGGGKQEMARARGRGFPPAVVIRTGFDTYEVADGNHRIDTWQEQGFDVIPVWVYDKYLRAAHTGS